MGKKLIHRYIIEVFEITPEIQLDKQEVKENLSQKVKEHIEDTEIILAGYKITRDKLKQLADKRKKELDDYYSPDYKLPDVQNDKR